MNTTDFETVTLRLLKQKHRIAIAARICQGSEDSFQLYEEQLQKEWRATVDALGPLSMDQWDKLSAIVHDLLVRANRETRETQGSTPSVLHGLADFEQSFRVEELLPPRVFA